MMRKLEWRRCERHSVAYRPGEACGLCVDEQLADAVVVETYRMPEEEIHAAEARGEHLLTEMTVEYHNLGAAPGWYESLGFTVEDCHTLVYGERKDRPACPDHPAHTWVNEDQSRRCSLEGCAWSAPAPEVGDGVALTSMAHPDGSLLAAELDAEAEEMEAEGDGVTVTETEDGGVVIQFDHVPVERHPLLIETVVQWQRDKMAEVFHPNQPDLSAITRDIARGG